jgi:hypothetical protein
MLMFIVLCFLLMIVTVVNASVIMDMCTLEAVVFLMISIVGISMDIMRKLVIQVGANVGMDM